jgi:hypothetical protein
VYWRRDDGIPGCRPTTDEVDSKYPWLDERVAQTFVSLHVDPETRRYRKQIEVIHVWRWTRYWGVLELYDPKTPEQLEQLRQSRAKGKAEREAQKERERFPLLFWTVERKEKE